MRYKKTAMSRFLHIIEETLVAHPTKESGTRVCETRLAYASELTDAANEHVAVGPEVTQPMPMLDPTILTPENVGNKVRLHIRLAPQRKCKHDLAAKISRDLLLMQEKELSVLLPHHSTLLPTPRKHLSSVDPVPVALCVEREEAIDTATDSELRHDLRMRIDLRQVCHHHVKQAVRRGMTDFI